jgi:uncharacterized protein YabN with tetrapyrrole methylase and pyrophosphatase domain
MSITAVVKRPNLIVANSVALTTTQSNPDITLKNNIASLNQSYVHSLLDVVEINPQDGYTLVYNANTHKYVVGPIQVPDVPLDGGSF